MKVKSCKQEIKKAKEGNEKKERKKERKKELINLKSKQKRMNESKIL